MIAVEPKIFFLGEPKMHLGSDDDPGVIQWLRHIGGQEALDCLLHVEGADIEKLIELLSRRCYKSYAPGLNPNVTKVRKSSASYHANIASSRHGSVVAHGHVTYAFEDVSRVFCFHPDTELLTIEGWKQVSQLTVSDVLLTKNPQTGISRWSMPKSMQRFEYSGQLLYWETSQGVSPMVTPDHLQWAAIYTGNIERDIQHARKIPTAELFGQTTLCIKRAWSQARPRTFVVDNAIQFSGEDPATISVDGVSYDSALFMEWLGWVTTDGCIHQDLSAVEIIQTKKAGVFRLKELHDQLFLKHNFYECDERPNKLFRVYSPKLAEFCATQLGGRLKSERNFSPWLMNLSDRLLNKFYIGALGGDGVVHKNNGHVVLACATEHTAKQWQVILARLGHSSNVRVTATRIGQERKLNGATIRCNHAENSISIHHKGQTRISIGQQRTMPYEGYVYCPETEDGLVFARYKGQALWTGNTHELVRNWVGNERSQESLRYVRLTDLRFWIPESITSRTERRLVECFPGTSGWTKEDGAVSMATPNEIFLHVISVCEWGQRALAQYFDIDNIKDFETKKKLTSAFRRIAPIGLATGIGVSFNLRSLRWIIEQRTDPAAEEEMRFVFGLIAEDAMKRWPQMFQDFEKTDTGDGLWHYVPKYSKI